MLIGVYRRSSAAHNDFFTASHGRGSNPSHDRRGVITYCTVRLAVLLTPPAVAVNVTTPGKRVVVIGTTAEFCPCGMIARDAAAAVSTELLFKSTRTPPIPAGPVSVTVACVLFPPTTWSGAMVRLESTTAAGGFTVNKTVCADPA